ncbi:Fur family transcriptional regulator [Microvirga flavescens]|uniref:Fur family transcriptional regulator n=1 Tax=Microvirga flavescens TaxID=2249811 RepID=UPI000DDAA51B|nr:transcriptional repressor [Microvirga flavescens]
MTPMRERVYRELVQSGGPVGAYDLVERLSSKSRRIAPVTIYRALDFLRDAGLVHRLATQNSYIVSHGEVDPGAVKIMFVCSRTGKSVEVHSKEVGDAIRKAAEDAGFKAISPFVEVEGEVIR